MNVNEITLTGTTASSQCNSSVIVRSMGAPASLLKAGADLMNKIRHQELEAKAAQKAAKGKD